MFTLAGSGTRPMSVHPNGGKTTRVGGSIVLALIGGRAFSSPASETAAARNSWLSTRTTRNGVIARAHAPRSLQLTHGAKSFCDDVGQRIRTGKADVSLDSRDTSLCELTALMCLSTATLWPRISAASCSTTRRCITRTATRLTTRSRISNSGSVVMAGARRKRTARPAPVLRRQRDHHVSN
jgi:hypothetical protein